MRRLKRSEDCLTRQSCLEVNNAVVTTRGIVPVVEVDEADDRGHSLNKVVEETSKKYDADIYVYSAAIDHEGFGKIVRCYEGSSRPNALLLLTTNGGLANSAYKIARFFQTQYDGFIIAIPSVCKSAGTLLACGANRLIMTPFSELGPLDVQLYARDEIGARRSGLLNHSAFEALKRETFDVYEHFMLSIKQRSGDNISFPLASEVAGDMASRLMAPVFEQVSPEALGSDYRDLQVAIQYGRRLALHGENLDIEIIDHLTNEYPSHDFIIDKWEAEQLFHRVDEPEPELYKLVSLLSDFVFSEHQDGVVACLTNSAMEDQDDQEYAGDEEGPPDLDDRAAPDSEGVDPQGEAGTAPPDRDQAV